MTDATPMPPAVTAPEAPQDPYLSDAPTDLADALPVASDPVEGQCLVCWFVNEPGADVCANCTADMVDTDSEAAEDNAAEAVTNDDGANEYGNTNDPADDARRPRAKAPRESLIRKVVFRAEPSDDGQTLEGYAAVFNDPALIDSYREGTFRESIEPGAFAKTISERNPVLMFDHGEHPMVGSIPIGSITALREDPRGLYIKAKLADNWLVQPVRDAIANGSIDGMSIRMSVINDNWTVGADRVSQRSIKEIALLELGPVVFPAYENTQVSVRSREVLTALSDPEVRGEIARVLASGTDVESAAEDAQEEPVSPGHSASHLTQLQRRARVLLATS